MFDFRRRDKGKSTWNCEGFPFNRVNKLGNKLKEVGVFLKKFFH